MIWYWSSTLPLNIRRGSRGGRSCREEFLAYIDQGLRFRRVPNQNRAGLIPRADNTLGWIEFIEAYTRQVHCDT